jgi:hypothetical protein
MERRRHDYADGVFILKGEEKIECNFVTPVKSMEFSNLPLLVCCPYDDEKLFSKWFLQIIRNPITTAMYAKNTSGHKTVP